MIIHARDGEVVTVRLAGLTVAGRFAGRMEDPYGSGIEVVKVGPWSINSDHVIAWSKGDKRPKSIRQSDPLQ